MQNKGICNWVRTTNRIAVCRFEICGSPRIGSFLDRLFLMKKPFALKSRKVQWPKSLLFTMQTEVVFDLWMAAETGTESPSNSEIVAQADLSTVSAEPGSDDSGVRLSPRSTAVLRESQDRMIITSLSVLGSIRGGGPVGRGPRTGVTV